MDASSKAIASSLDSRSLPFYIGLIGRVFSAAEIGSHRARALYSFQFAGR